MITKEQAIEIIKTVQDPEIGIDVWTLGLIYNLDIKEEAAMVQMTLTSPMCPFGPQILSEIKSKLIIGGLKDVEINLVFDPPWLPSEELRAMLGI